MVGDGQCARVDLPGVLALGQRNAVGIAIGPGVAMGSDFDARRYSAQLGSLQQIDPVIQSAVSIGLADKEEVKAVQQGASAKGLVGVNVIAQQDGPEGSVLGSVRQLARCPAWCKLWKTASQ